MATLAWKIFPASVLRNRTSEAAGGLRIVIKPLSTWLQYCVLGAGGNLPPFQGSVNPHLLRRPCKQIAGFTHYLSGLIFPSRPYPRVGRAVISPYQWYIRRWLALNSIPRITIPFWIRKIATGKLSNVRGQRYTVKESKGAGQERRNKKKGKIREG